MKKIYHKLVRDKIPEIIKENGGRPEARSLGDREFVVELLKKLEEETKELSEAYRDKQELIKEMGDVYEVIDAIIDYYKIDRKEVMKLKSERKIERGGFEKRIFLKNVEE